MSLGANGRASQRKAASAAIGGLLKHLAELQNKYIQFIGDNSTLLIAVNRLRLARRLPVSHWRIKINCASPEVL